MLVVVLPKQNLSLNMMVKILQAAGHMTFLIRPAVTDKILLEGPATWRPCTVQCTGPTMLCKFVEGVNYGPPLAQRSRL